MNVRESEETLTSQKLVRESQETLTSRIIEENVKTEIECEIGTNLLQFVRDCCEQKTIINEKIENWKILTKNLVDPKVQNS